MTRVRLSLTGRRDLLALAAAFPERYPGLLESAARGGERPRYDILFAHPQSALQLDADGRVRDGEGRVLEGDFLDLLDAHHAEARKEADAGHGLPFGGGWLVYLGYEYAGHVEPRLRLPAADDGLPVALALRCPAAIVVDHAEDRTILIAEAGHAGLVESMARDLDAAPAFDAALPARIAIDEDVPQRFLDGVARIGEYLAAGDVFQVNLSRGWRARFAAAVAPAALHAALRRANPAPYAALLQWRGAAVVSSSPERLVEVRGDRVQTRPIAGTRPRLAGEDEAGRVRELVGHPKERAEHVMLIDLERNDLGRICVPGSVVVDELMTVESYAHVHHIVSNVAGRLRASVSPGAVLRAVFPGGTITGCPKVRCMEIIAELEGRGRGAYTGSIGYLDRGGAMDFNILIRTLVASGDSVRWRAGAGIVFDSQAGAELEETRAKARGLLRALGDAP